MVLAIILVVVMIAALVLVHELGHFILARRHGVNVEEFGFGFPPRLFGRRVGPTLYSINLLPLGGFVRMQGEDSADRRKGSFGAVSLLARTKILLAGVIMNLLVAYLILLGLCVTGLPPILANQVSLGNPTQVRPYQLVAVSIVVGSPAASAGIKQGDIIERIDGQSFTTTEALVKFTKQHAGTQVVVETRRGNEARRQSVKLRPPDAKSGYLGVTPLQTNELAYGWWSPVQAAALVGQLIWATLAGLGGLVVGLFSRGNISGEVAGPVGMVAILQNLLHLGAAYVWIFVAGISLSLAVLNVLPIPALDGGRFAFMFIRRYAGKAISARVEGAIHMVGFIILIGLMLVVTFFDILNLGT